MSNIVVTIPPSIDKYTIFFKMFIDGMLQKLDKNSHKDTPTINTIPEILDKLEEEIVEFQEQMFGDPMGENGLIELMDVANFAFLAYVALRNQGVNHASSDQHTRQRV